ncbi:hypothetical protein ACFQ38_16125 [Sporosarcina contaminans]|uniref:Fibronectin type-III domain-containing protein n=1 Tax=Sporosarcina contaminans TaxID=633403 RepID=A0ABW3U1X9_9BACL
MGSQVLRFNAFHSITITIERELKNTAPTTPGAFTQPTGELEIGDSKVFSVGASSDAEGNLSKYIWEASVNGGSYSKVGETSTPSITYKIPTATSLRMRVKAADSGGLESEYRTSGSFVVTKPKYYWSKYNTVVKRIFNDDAPWSNRGNTSIRFDSPDITKGYSFNSNDNLYVPSGGRFGSDENIPQLSSAYYIYDGGKGLRKYTYYLPTTKKANEYIEVDFVGKIASDNTSTTQYERGTLVQSGIVAIEGTYPLDGRHTDGYWYVRNSRVNQSIAPPAPFTAPAPGTVLEPKQSLTLAFGASTAPSISTYEVQSRYNDGAWQNVGSHTNALTRAFTVTDDKSLTTVEFRVRAKNTSGVYSDYVYSETFTIQHNKVPTITLETENNKTLYENDTYMIKGTALEPDIGDVLIVYYRINGGTARGIETKLSDGKPVPFSEQLTFKSGKLYKGDTAITDTLRDGTPYTLEVWATDNQGGESEIETRTFYVVPNRPPSLTINPIEDVTGMIDADKITITGTSFDADDNDVIVRYRINNGINVEIHNGPVGEFSFDIPLSKLIDGENSIVVEVSDTYDFKYSRTIKLNKSANLTPLASTVMRYIIVPPSGSAQRLSLWIERDESQEVIVEISMTNGTEPEQFTRMILNDEDSKSDPEPAPIALGIVEDFWKWKADEPKEHIAIKISWTGDKPIFKVSGALLQ